MAKTEILIVNAVAMQTKGVGDYVYRVEQPSVAMGMIPGVNVINITTISPHFEYYCLLADVLVAHLLTEHDFLPILLKRKEMNKPTVYEVSDNFIALAIEEKARGWFTDPVNSALCFQYIQMADYIQVTSQGLNEYYKALNENVVIFENNIRDLCHTEKPEREKVVIGWGGSDGHANDLRAIKGAIEYVCDKHPNVIFSFMGSKYLVNEIFDLIPSSQLQYTEPGNLKDYIKFVGNLDIGIAPMLDTDYNRCRSDVKFLEYSSKGAAAVVSDVLPYRAHVINGKTGLLFKDDKELILCLEKLILSKAKRKELAENAYNYISIERIEEKRSIERVNFYTSLCSRHGSLELNKSHFIILEQGSKAYEIKKSNEEINLKDGIRAEFSGNSSKARILYKKSVKTNPDYYLPHFWLGYSHMLSGNNKEALGHFRNAIKKNSKSLRSLLLAGKLLINDAPEESLSFFDRALEISTFYAPAIEAIGSIAEKQNQYTASAEIYNSALVANPYYSPAALGLARVYKIMGDEDKMLKSLNIASDIAPHTVEPLYQLAEFYYDKGDTVKSSEFCLKAFDLNPKHKPTISIINRMVNNNGCNHS